MALRKLTRFLQAEGLLTDAHQVGPDEMRRFIRYLQHVPRYTDHRLTSVQSNGLSAHTINGYLRSIRAAWNRWLREGLVRGSPFGTVKLPRVPVKVISVFTAEQLGVLFGAIDWSTPQGFRDHVFLETLL
ncbi:phage integrase SAM-like domain-containing protein, partial [Chloroflexota bacterium]